MSEPTAAPTFVNQDVIGIYIMLGLAIVFMCWCSYKFFGGRRVYARPGDQIVVTA